MHGARATAAIQEPEADDERQPVIEIYFDFAEIEFDGEVIKILAYTEHNGLRVAVCRGIVPRSGFYRTLFGFMARMLPGVFRRSDPSHH